MDTDKDCLSEAFLKNKLNEEEGDTGERKSAKSWCSSLAEKVWAETQMIWYIAGPAILTSIFQYSLASVTQTLIGHVGALELAAVGIQNLVVAGLCFGVMLGMGSALETLCGQACGAGKMSLLGIYLQRSWVILFITGVLLLPSYIFAAPILKLIGQSPEISDLAGKFSIWMTPEVFAFALNFPIQKFLQAQSKVMVMLWISMGVLVLHVLASWLCIVKLEMGLLGAAVTLNISWWVLAIAQLVYVVSGSCKESWSGFSLLAFSDLASFVRLSLASAVMLCLEYWNLMLVVLLAGFLKNAKIAVDAASICMNVEGWTFMIPLGFTAAISVRVSNELGAGRPKAAKFSIWVMVSMSVFIQTAFMLIILLTRKQFPAFFTDDKEVMAEVSRIAIFLSVSIMLSSIQPVLSGAAIGAGWQTTFAYVNIGCYYLVGLTVAVLLGFKFNFGLEGIWSGFLIGIFLQTIILIIITCCTDWEKESASTKERVLAWESSATERSDLRADEI